MEGRRAEPARPRARRDGGEARRGRARLSSVEDDPSRTLAPELPVTRLRSVFGRDAGSLIGYFLAYLPTQIVPAIAGFLVLPILGRRLAPTELGVLAIAQALATTGWIAIGSWLTIAIVRELPAHVQENRNRAFAALLGRALGLAVLLTGVFAAGLAVLSLVSEAVADNLGLIVATTAGLALHNIGLTLFSARMEALKYGLLNIAGRLGGTVLGAMLVFEGYGVTGYLVGTSFVSLGAGAVALIWGWPRGGSGDGADWGEVRSWLSYGLPLASAELVAWVLLIVDRYLLTVLKDAGATGIYVVGNIIGDKFVTMPALALFTAAWPLLVGAFDRDGRLAVERLMRTYTRVMIVLVVAIAAFVTLTADQLVRGLAGDLYYADSVGAVPWVAAGSIFYVLTMVGNAGLVMARRTLPMLYAAGIGIVCNVVANLILIPPLGVKGAAIATPIGTLAYLLAARHWAGRYASWHFPWRTAARAVAAAAAGYAAGWGALKSVHQLSVQVALAALAGGAVYVLALEVLGERRDRG